VTIAALAALAPAPRHREIAIDVAVCVAIGLWALALGQSANWDLQNYHLYNPWAWLNGRLDRDIAPAQLQSYFNPLLHVPFYLAVVTLPATLVTFLLGTLQGVNVVLLRRLAIVLLPEAWIDTRRWLPWLIAFAGLGATMIGELGTSYGDNIVSIPALLALLLATRVRDDVSPVRLAAATGALLGIAVGLKLTMLPTVIGVALAATIIARGWHARWLMPAMIAGLTAIALTAGPWAWEMATRWQDPLFPWLSTPPFGEALTPNSIQDPRWKPRGIVAVMTYPWQWLANWRLVSELRFRDVRIPLLFALAILLPWWRAVDATQRRRAFAFALLAITIYLPWAAISGYYRYLATFEMLAPLAIVMLIAAATPSLPTPRTARVVAIVLAVVIVTTNPPNWGRLRHHGAQYLEVNWPERASTRDALLLLSGDEPLADLAVVFPRDVDVVRIDGNLYGGARAPIVHDYLVATRIDAHRGALLLIASGADPAVLRANARQVGLAIDPAQCDALPVNLRARWQPPVWLCTVVRVEPARDALARR
jgi:hypothetical protein